jgi:hypothetical protein
LNPDLVVLDMINEWHAGGARVETNVVFLTVQQDEEEPNNKTRA